MNELQQQEISFDYSVLDIETQAFIKVKEQTIKNRTVQTIIDNGRDLLEVKERLPHGQFQKWIECNFPWTYRTAKNMMNVSEKIKSESLSLLDFTNEALYLLAQNSTPEPARQEAVDRAEAGEKIDIKTAKQIKDAHTRIADQNLKLQDLQSEIDNLKNQLPTDENKQEINQLKGKKFELESKICQLEANLRAEKNKPPEKEIIVKAPDDYDKLKADNEKKDKIIKEKTKYNSELRSNEIRLQEELEQRQKMITQTDYYISEFQSYRNSFNSQISYLQEHIKAGIVKDSTEIDKLINDIKIKIDDYQNNNNNAVIDI